MNTMTKALLVVNTMLVLQWSLLVQDFSYLLDAVVWQVTYRLHSPDFLGKVLADQQLCGVAGGTWCLGACL